MFKKSRSIGILIFGILLVAISAAVASFIYFKPIPAVQAAPPVNEVYLHPDNPDGSAWRDVCIVTDVMVAPDRLHVRCSVAEPANVFYFAIQGDASHSLIANRFLVILNTAYALAKPVYILYDTDTSHNPPGCGVTNCRLILWMGILS